MSHTSYYLVPAAPAYYPGPQHDFDQYWAPQFDNNHASPYSQSPYYWPPAMSHATSSDRIEYSPISSPSPPAPSRSFLGMNVPKKKGRAMQACDHCRLRKQRCDEGLPCSYCKEHDLVCNYRPIVPTKFENVLETMVQWISGQSENLLALSRKMDSLDETLRRHEAKARLTRSASPRSTPHFSAFEEKPPQNPPRTATRRSRHESILHWPEVRNIFSEAVVDFDLSYLVAAEDRPVLKLRKSLEGDDEASSEQSQVFSDGTNGDLPHYGRTTGKRKRDSSEVIEPPRCDLDALKIDGLIAAFIEYVLKLEPFLETSWLRQAVHNFKESYASSKAVRGIPPHKRRYLGPSTHRTTPGEFDKSPSTAIVLLSLAIGESIMEGNKSGWRDPQGAWEETPGVTYFQEAINILAAHMDGNELVHAQMFLLAAIYKAQLARMNEASSWYSMAGRVLLHLVHRRRLLPSDSQPSGIEHHLAPSDVEKDLILTTAWSCIQLEDEITPDLRLPSSGLGDIAHKLPLPRTCNRTSNATDSKTQLRAQEAVPDHVLVQDSKNRLTQLSRKYRNEGAFSNEENESSEDIIAALAQYGTELDLWREELTVELRWKDKDPLTGDLLTGRLRHSFWEAKLKSLQPYLDFTLHALSSTKQVAHDETESECRSSPASTCDTTFAAINETVQNHGASVIVDNARLCVHAAKKSIAAFDGIRERLVVPDLLSLMHGRFSNALLLVAAYRCEHLRDLVSYEELRQALQQTVTSLEAFSTLSPAGEADWKILRAVFVRFENGRL